MPRLSRRGSSTGRPSDGNVSTQRSPTSRSYWGSRIKCTKHNSFVSPVRYAEWPAPRSPTCRSGALGGMCVRALDLVIGAGDLALFVAS